jgi:hypothetical protein
VAIRRVKSCFVCSGTQNADPNVLKTSAENSGQPQEVSLFPFLVSLSCILIEIISKLTSKQAKKDAENTKQKFRPFSRQERYQRGKS